MDTGDKFLWICIVPICISICILGILGNILSIIIWHRVVRNNIQGNTSTATYLIALGICDIGYLAFFILTESLPTAVENIKTSHVYSAFFSWISYPMLHIFLIASIWLVVSITVNRWVLITFPTRGKNWYSKPRTYNGIVVIILFSVLFNIPHFFNFYPKKENGVYQLSLTDYGVSGASKDFHFWCHCIFLTLIPWIVIAVLNILIIRKLRERTVKLVSLQSQTSRAIHDHQVTIMLLTITFTFLGLLGWQCITQCLYNKGYQKDKEIIWQYVTNSYVLGKLGLVINSSMNCIFYCFSGTNFRVEMIRTLSCSPMRQSCMLNSLQKQSASKWEPSKNMLTYGTSSAISNSSAV